MLKVKYFMVNNAKTATPNSAHSSNNLATPGMAMGAGFGSFGMRNTPQSVAAIKGRPMAAKYRSQPPAACQPQYPSAASMAISNKNRTARFIGCVFINRIKTDAVWLI